MEDPWITCLRLEPANDDLLENGCSYERASVDFTSFRGLVVPTNTIVRRGLSTDGFNLYVDKIQAFTGWPAHRISIATLRASMGVAFRVNGQALALATYGEWKVFEGGGTVRLSILVPTELDVRFRDDLGGPEGMANTYVAGEVGPGSGHPKVGWSAIATEPNPEATRI